MLRKDRFKKADQLLGLAMRVNMQLIDCRMPFEVVPHLEEAQRNLMRAIDALKYPNETDKGVKK